MPWKLVLLCSLIPLFLAWTLLFYHRAVEKKAARKLFWFAIIMACSALYLLVVRFATGTPWHPLVFVPLNLAFLPLYLYFGYSRLLFSSCVPDRWMQVLGILVLVELSSALLPLGAWWYSSDFDGSMVRFAFKIKRGMLVLFTPVVLWCCGEVYYRLKYFRSQSLPPERYHRLTPQWYGALVLIPLGLLPPFASFFGYRGYAFYELQGGISLLVVAYLLYRHLKHVDTYLLESARDKIAFSSTYQHFEAFLAYVNRPEVLFQSGLRLQEVATALDLSPNYLSTIVNTHTPGGFVDYLNKCRVEALLEKFKAGEHQHKTISALAEEVGFGSKSAFQAVFRKQTGLTPSVWIQNHLL